jgi:hypothetical protein
MDSALAGVILQESNPNFGNRIVGVIYRFCILEIISFQSLKSWTFLAKVVSVLCTWSAVPDPPSPLHPPLHTIPSSFFFFAETFNPVAQARSLVSGQLVATKQINIEQHEADLESCRLEIQILNDCCHPNVVQYLGSYVFDDVLWINLEYFSPALCPCRCSIIIFVLQILRRWISR